MFDKEKFVKAGINLEFLKINLTPYTQKKPQFLEGLSIIDVMMFNSPERINEMLNDYTIITK